MTDKKIEEVFSPMEFYKGLRTHFKIERQPNKYLCRVSLMVKKISIDITAFDDWLHLKHGEYETERNLSMSELIKKEYGEDAEVFIKKYIK